MSRMMLWAGVILVGICGSVRGQDVSDDPVTPAGHHERSGVAPLFHRRAVPYCPTCPECPPITPAMPGTPGTPGMPPGTPVEPGMPPTTTPPDLSSLTTPFATAPEGGGLQGRSFNESFDGDFGGVMYCRNVVAGSIFVRQQVGTRQETITVFRDGVPFKRTITVPVFANVPVPNVRQALVPVPGRYSGIMLTDNDSPRPMDRVYFNYGYYDGINAQMNPGIGNITQNRPMIGFEKTFLNRNASIGLRLPFIQLNGPPGTGADTVGDLSILTKYAFVNRPNGDVIAGGLILTVPTGPQGGLLCDGTPVPHSTLFQPWAGFVQVFDRAYVQGVTAIVVPTDSRDVTLFAHSFGVGYWLYRADGDRMLRGIIPVAEVHIRTPLDHRNPNGTVFLQDQVNLTGGLHLRFPRATFGGAVCVPTIAPRPWNVEAIANFTYYF